MAFKAKFLFINEKLLPKNIFKEIIFYIMYYMPC